MELPGTPTKKLHEYPGQHSPTKVDVVRIPAREATEMGAWKVRRKMKHSSISCLQLDIIGYLEGDEIFAQLPLLNECILTTK